MSVLMIKTVYEKNFIVIEAKKSMSLAITNTYILPDVIPALIECLQGKNLTLSEYAIGYMHELTQNIDVEYFKQISPELI